MIKLNPQSVIAPSPLARVFTEGIAIDDDVLFHLRTFDYRSTTEIHLHPETHQTAQLQECPAAQWSIDTAALGKLDLPTVEMNLRQLHDIWQGEPGVFNSFHDAILSDAARLNIVAGQRGHGLQFVLTLGGQEFSSTSDKGTGEIPKSWIVPTKQMAKRQRVATEGQMLSELLAAGTVKTGTVLVNNINTYAVTEIKDQSWCWAVHLEGSGINLCDRTEHRLEGEDRFLVEDSAPWQRALPQRWKRLTKRYQPAF